MRKVRFTTLIGAVLAVFLALGGFTYFSAARQVNQSVSSQNQATVSTQRTTNELKVVFLDVGQADAAYVQLGEHRMLIDGGNREDSSLIYSFLQHEGAGHLDCIVNTHPHEDHVGGLSGAFRIAQVDRVYSSVTDYDSKAFANFKNSAAEQGLDIIVPNPGDTIDFGDAEVTFIQLGQDYRDENENSLVVRIVYGETAFLFTGDIGEQAERDLVESGQPLESTVLKVPHHGSKYSSTYRFLREVNASLSVISVGADNKYGHPTEVILSRLRDQGTQLYRTDLQGDVTMMSDGIKVSVGVDHSPEADVYVENDAYEE